MGPIGIYWQVPSNLRPEEWQGGELLAWRVWRLVCGPDRGLRLASLSQDTTWDGPVLTASQRPVAMPYNGAGIYALKPATRPGRGRFDWAMGGDTWVRGWVSLSGQVVEHQHGYRAERVVIRRLRLGAAAHRFFQTPEALAAARFELERRYQCAVRIAGIDARIARGFVSPMKLRSAPGWIALAPASAPAPQISPRPAVPVPPPQPRPRHRAETPRGVSPDGIRYDAVRRVFAQAQRALGTDWNLYGRGHCERVTLKPHYSRHARLGAPQSVAHFSPRGCVGWCWIYPAALVRRAASLLRIDANVLVSRWL